MCEALLEWRLKRLFIGRSDLRTENAGVNIRRAFHRCFHRLVAATVWLALLQLSPPALAGGDQDRARTAVQAGKVLPLKSLLERLEREHPGQVLETELEFEDGRWVYEIRLLQPGGQLVKLEVDAATAKVLQRKAHPGSASAPH